MKEYTASIRLDRFGFRRRELEDQRAMMEFTRRQLCQELAAAIMKDGVEFEEIIDPPTGDMIIRARILIASRDDRRYARMIDPPMTASDIVRRNSDIVDKIEEIKTRMNRDISRQMMDDLVRDGLDRAKAEMAKIDPVAFLGDRIQRSKDRDAAVAEAREKRKGLDQIAKATRTQASPPIVEIAVRKIQMPE